MASERNSMKRKITKARKVDINKRLTYKTESFSLFATGREASDFSL